MTRWSAITRTPPQLLRARLRLALHSRGGQDLNRLVHHERGHYFKHWATLSGRFGKSDTRFATTLLGVTRLFTPELLVLLEATAVD